MAESRELREFSFCAPLTDNEDMVRQILIAAPVAVGCPGGSGDGGGKTDPCENQPCSGHGECFVDSASGAACDCHPGYDDVALTCVANCDQGYVAVDDECGPAPCELEDCSNYGAGVDGSDGLECICDPGYMAVGLSCRPRCSGVDCSGHGVCVQDGTGVRCLCDSG